MINNVVLVGRITKDPELKYTSSNIANVQFTIACNRQYVNQQTGDYDADFINCVAWRQSAEFMSKYIKKGYMIGVTGRIQTRSYQAQDGSTRYVTEVVCDSVNNLQPRSENQQQPGFNQFQEQRQFSKPSQMTQPDTFNVSDVSEDDLPF